MFAFSQSNKSATDCVSSTMLVVVVAAVVVVVVGAADVVVGGSETKINNNINLPVCVLCTAV